MLTYGELRQGAAQTLGDDRHIPQLGLLATPLLTQYLVLQPRVALPTVTCTMSHPTSVCASTRTIQPSNNEQTSEL